MSNNCENCIEGRPRIGRLAGVTRTMRLALYEGEGVPEGTPQDLTGLTVVVRVLRDGTNDIYTPGFVVEGEDNNVIKFTWPADQQAVGNYTLDVTMTDGSDNVNRVNWHGKDGIRLVEYSNQVYGDDATGAESSEAVGLVGYFTAGGVGMSAYEEWLASDESAGYPQTVAGYMQWQQHAATEAAAEVLAELGSRDGSAAGDGTMWGDYKSAEAQRNTDYGTAEEHRDGEYATAEAARDTRYGTAEGTSGSAAGNGSRWGAYKTAEAARDGEYSSAEGHRDSEYSSAEGHRDGEYATAEAARDTLYGQAEGTASSAAGSNNRWGSYKTAEAARNTARETAEGTAASSAGDGTRWGAYKTAEAARNTARENAEGTASSTAGDGTRWGAYKTAEAARGTAYGTAEGTSSSTAGDGSRWGAYKTAEAARSEQLNDLEAEVTQLGQEVDNLPDTSHLSNPAENTLAKAEDVMQLRTKMADATANGTKVILEQNTNWYDGKYLRINGAEVSFSASTGATPDGVLIVNIEGYKRVRFLGIAQTLGLPIIGFGFSASRPDPTDVSTNQFDFGYSIFDGDVDPSNNAYVEREYLLDIPDGAKWASITIAKNVNLYHTQTSLADFYCYLEVGENVKDRITESIEGFVHGYAIPIQFARSGNFSYEVSPTIQNSTYYGISSPIHIKKGYTVHVISRGAGVTYIATCDANGGNLVRQAWKDSQQPVTTEHFTFTATEDCYVMVCARNAMANIEPSKLYYTVPSQLDEFIGLYLNNNSMDKTKKIFIAELTMAAVSAQGSIIQYGSSILTEAKKHVASIYFIEIGDRTSGEKIKCKPLADINAGETYTIFFFDENYASISSSELSSNEDYEASIPENAKYLRLVVTSSDDLAYSVRYVEVSAKTSVLRWSGVRNFLTTQDYITQSGTLKYYRTVFEVPYKGNRLVNVGWFFYSTDYTPFNKKAKLALLYTGSDAYKWRQEWSNFSDNYHSIVFSLVHSGYCVALCSCLTSLYGENHEGISDCSGDQLSVNAYESYYKYIISNFNVEAEPYVVGYSNGGMPCGRFNILGNIPAKAIAGGAIVTDLVGMLRILGNVNNINKILHNCGVPENIVVEHAGPAFTDSDYAVLKSQGDILRNYSPLFMSCDGLDWGEWIDTMKEVSFVNMETNPALVSLMENVTIQSKVPIKMWHARDDVNVSYGIEKFYIEAVNRGGGRAFLRTMPNDAGKHAMGNYGNENSIKVQDYHFKDGTVANTTLFMAEVLDWFSSWQDEPLIE